MLDWNFKSVKNNFPEKECVIPDEKDVWIADKYYWCLLQHKVYKEDYMIKKLKPYINKFEGKTYYGWIDKYRNTWDNKYKFIHNDDYQIIGIQELPVS